MLPDICGNSSATRLPLVSQHIVCVLAEIGALLLLLLLTTAAAATARVLLHALLLLPLRVDSYSRRCSVRCSACDSLP